MTAIRLIWLRLLLWGVNRDILQIEYRLQVIRNDLDEWKVRKLALELEIFNEERT